MSTEKPTVDVEELSVEEGHQAFEAAALRLVGLDRKQALAALDSGEWHTEHDNEAWQELRMLAPFGRDPEDETKQPVIPLKRGAFKSVDYSKNPIRDRLAAQMAKTLPDDDDWLSGTTACSIENGADCEACQ